MALEDSIVLSDEVATNDDLPTALSRFGDRRYERVRTVVEISEQIAQWEIDQVHDADMVGTMRKSVTVTAEPI